MVTTIFARRFRNRRLPLGGTCFLAVDRVGHANTLGLENAESSDNYNWQWYVLPSFNRLA